MLLIRKPQRKQHVGWGEPANPSDSEIAVSGRTRQCCDGARRLRHGTPGIGLIAASAGVRKLTPAYVLCERAVRVDGELIEDPQRLFHAGFEGLLQIGKRNFARVRLRR